MDYPQSNINQVASRWIEHEGRLYNLSKYAQIIPLPDEKLVILSPGSQNTTSSECCELEFDTVDDMVDFFHEICKKLL